MTRILAENLCLDIPLQSAHGWSLRATAVRKLTGIGGQLLGEGGKSHVRALENVNFDLNTGDRLALMGHNGAGKTTLLRVIGGIIAPTSGSLKLSGSLMPMFDLSAGFDEESTGYENIMLRGLVEGLSREEIARRTPGIVEFSELGDYLDLPLRAYSSGMRLRLMFSIATAVAGDIILMDEWISVGDQPFQEKTQAKLLELTGNAGILVIASHDIATLRNVCNKAIVLEHGRVIRFGAFDDVVPVEG